MKITGITGVVADVPFKNNFHPFGRYQKSLKWIIVRVHTDEGITGVAGTQWGLETVRDLVKPRLVGMDPFAIEQIAPILRECNSRGMWPWFVEAALWDIIGKASNQPIYKLLGGHSNKVRAYASSMELRDPATRAENAKRLVAEGIQGIKLRFRSSNPREDLKLVEAVRDAVGESFTIMVDANQANFDNQYKWDYRTALMIARELEKLGVYWLEEPLERYNLDHLSRLQSEVDLAIAGGEWNVGLHEFRILLEKGCYDILQPDCTSSEGLFQVRKIMALAEMHHKEVSLHTWSNGLGLLAHLHLAASAPNVKWFEMPYDPPALMLDDAFQELLQEPITINKEGYVEVPDRPGLGIELDEDKVKKYTVESI